jgi:hypothetical protein
MLRIYVDDSADERQERAVAAGAYVGFYDQWNRLREGWKKRLKKDGLKFFHTTACYNLREEFERFRDLYKYPKPEGRRAADAILGDLESIIHDAEIMGIAVCIPLEMYNEVRENERHAATVFPPDAFQIALITLFKSCAEIACDEFRSPEKIVFTCDESNRSDITDRLYAQFRIDNPNLSQFIEGLRHQDDKKVIPLQAADLMAHLARRRFIDWLDDPNKAVFTANEELKKRLKRLNVHAIQCWDRRYMMAVLEHEKRRRRLAE